MPAALLATFLFALTAVCATQSARALGGIRANGLRMLIAVVILGLWVPFSGTDTMPGVFPILVLAGGIGFGGGGLCMYQALVRIGSTLSLLVVECGAAIITSFLAWIWLGAALSRTQIFFGLLSIGGVLIGLAPYRLPKVSQATLLAGAGFAATAALAQGISWNLSKVAFHQAATATLISVPLSRRLEHRSPGFNYYSGACISIIGTAGLLLITGSG